MFVVGAEPGELGGVAPSEILTAADFVGEIERIDATFPANLAELRGLERPDVKLIPRAQLCCTELLKFELDEAERARAEAFKRKYDAWRTEIWAQMAEEYRTGILKSTPPAKPAPTYRLDPAAIKAHGRWLAEKEDGVRLEVRDFDASGRVWASLDLSGARFERVDLSRAELHFTQLHGATLTDVSLDGADISGAMIAGTTLTRVSFVKASTARANLGDAELVDCDFSSANLERSTWYRSKVTRCNFVGANLIDTGLDRAVFTDCNFRGAALQEERAPCSDFEAVFERCDLRDTNWTDRGLHRVKFIDCLLDGVHGRPQVTTTTFTYNGADSWRESVARWGIDPDHPRKGLTKREPFRFTEGEYAVVRPLFGELSAIELSAKRYDGHVTAELRFPVEAPLQDQLDAKLASYRASIAPPPTKRDLKHAALAQSIIDESIDAGLSFEETVHALVLRGFSDEEAVTAMTRPVLP